MNIVEIIGHSLALGLLLGAVLKFLPTRNKTARWLAVAMVWLFTIKYFTWRLDSLPGFALALGSLWPLSFFALEVLTIAYELWGYLVMGRTTNRTPEADDGERRLREFRKWDLPTVDVFIATYNEPLDILEKTIRAALSLDYPPTKLTVHVGDDGGRPKLEELCKRLGATYHSRPKLPDGSGKVGGDGKAGNDRYTFSRSSGEFIIMLDADFVLVKNFIWRTLGLLLFCPNRALVQTPQRFYNVDVFGLNLRTRQVPDEQHFFMTITQACRDAWGNAFCVGSNCMVRRKHVEL